MKSREEKGEDKRRERSIEWGGERNREQRRS